MNGGMSDFLHEVEEVAGRDLRAVTERQFARLDVPSRPKLGLAVGAKAIDLEWVQVHLTGLVKPDVPHAKIKFLAAEAFR